MRAGCDGCCVGLRRTSASRQQRSVMLVVALRASYGGEARDAKSHDRTTSAFIALIGKGGRLRFLNVNVCNLPGHVTAIASRCQFIKCFGIE